MYIYTNPSYQPLRMSDAESIRHHEQTTQRLNKIREYMLLEKERREEFYQKERIK